MLSLSECLCPTHEPLSQDPPYHIAAALPLEHVPRATVVLRLCPTHTQVGHMVYVTVPETAARVKQVADRLGLQHRGVHNAGPTWYGDAATVVAVGNLSVPVLYHLLDEHFEKNPDGTWRQNWAQGEVRRRSAVRCFSNIER